MAAIMYKNKKYTGGGGGGADTQVTEMPTADESYENVAVQYMGVSTSTYKHGESYECVSNNGTYVWQPLKLETQVTTMPVASAAYVGKAVQYIGATSGSLVKGEFYEVANNNGTYSWVKIKQDTQVTTMPTASAAYVGKAVLYLGETSGNFVHGFYYECVNNNGTYSWQTLNTAAIRYTEEPNEAGGTTVIIST